MKGTQRFTDRVACFAPKVGVVVAGIKVKDMGYRFLYSGHLDSDTKSQYHFKREQHTP